MQPGLDLRRDRLRWRHAEAAEMEQGIACMLASQRLPDDGERIGIADLDSLERDRGRDPHARILRRIKPAAQRGDGGGRRRAQSPDGLVNFIEMNDLGLGHVPRGGVEKRLKLRQHGRRRFAHPGQGVRG
jgi:hypothetical protein